MNDYSILPFKKCSNSSLPINKPECFLVTSNSNLNPIIDSPDGVCSLKIERKSEGLYIVTGELLFRVSGLNIENLHRLKVALRVSKSDKQGDEYCQFLDLYRSDERNFFAEEAFGKQQSRQVLLKQNYEY
jgi:hypothetical protein